MAKESESIYAPLKLEPRKNPDSWKTEETVVQFFVPPRSPFIGQTVSALVKKYGIEIKAPESKVLKAGSTIVFKGESAKVDKAFNDLFPAK